MHYWCPKFIFLFFASLLKNWLFEIKFFLLLLFVAVHCEWVIDRPATIDHFTLHPCCIEILSNFSTLALSQFFLAQKLLFSVFWMIVQLRLFFVTNIYYMFLVNILLWYQSIMMPNDGPMQVIIAKLINWIGLILPRFKKKRNTVVVMMKRKINYFSQW